MRVFSTLLFYNTPVTKNKLTPLAQKLRREATKEENHLWYEFLSTYPIRFRRQKVIGKYILAFYCSKAKLAVELDGNQHFTEISYIKDQERTQWLQDNGIRVIRFLNSDVRNHLSEVCGAINAVVKEQMELLAEK